MASKLKGSEKWFRPSTEGELIEWGNSKSRNFMERHNCDDAGHSRVTRVDHTVNLNAVDIGAALGFSGWNLEGELDHIDAKQYIIE